MSVFLASQLLGCSLMDITRSYWAVKLHAPDEWICEARMVTDVLQGRERHFDWSNDLVATGDVRRITELWLLCPPSRTAPLGNTARLPILESGTAFQLKIATVDTSLALTARQQQGHIIGRVVDKLTGACECFIWDEEQQGLLTPETPIYDPLSFDFKQRDALGHLTTAGKTSVYDFHAWKPSIAHLGRLDCATLGLTL